MLPPLIVNTIEIVRDLAPAYPNLPKWWRHLPESNRPPKLCRLLYNRSTKAPGHVHYREKTKNANLLTRETAEKVDIVLDIFFRRKSCMHQIYLSSTNLCRLDKFESWRTRIVFCLKYINTRLIRVTKKDCLIRKCSIFKIIFTGLEIIEITIFTRRHWSFEFIFQNEEGTRKAILCLRRNTHIDNLSRNRRRYISSLWRSKILRNPQGKTRC